MLSWKKKEESMNEKKAAAFNTIYVEHSLVLRKLAANYGVPNEEVEDIVHDTFLAFFSHYALDMEVNKMKVLLTKLLKNRCIVYWRRNNKIENNPGIGTPAKHSAIQNTFSTPDSFSIELKQAEADCFWQTMKDMRSDWQVRVGKNHLVIRKVAQYLRDIAPDIHR